MRPIAILGLAQVPLYVFGFAMALHATANAAACDPATSSTPCVVTAMPAAAAPAPANPLEKVQLDDGDVVQAASGDMIVIQRDPASGAYTIGVARGQ